VRTEIYCIIGSTLEAQSRSHNGALWSKKLGYTNIYRHPGGILAWLQADYPVEKIKSFHSRLFTTKQAAMPLFVDGWDMALQPLVQIRHGESAIHRSCFHSYH
jgi:hypothetical protein